MKKLSFRFGCLLILFALFALLTSSPGNFYNVTFHEFLAVSGVGVLFILPELIRQLRWLRSSRSKVDRW